MRNLPVPKNLKNVQEVMGLFQYYKVFVPDFARIAAPLYELLKKDTPFIWNQEAQKAFDTLKEKMSEAPVLAHPKYDQPFILYTDASYLGLGFVLAQQAEDGREHPVRYGGRKLLPAEKNYTITELECLGVVWSVRKNKQFLAQNKFCLITDHKALETLRKQELPAIGRRTRWILELEQYNYTIHHRKGKKMAHVDCFSRNLNNATWVEEPIYEDNSSTYEDWRWNESPTTTEPSYPRQDAELVNEAWWETTPENQQWWENEQTPSTQTPQPSLINEAWWETTTTSPAKYYYEKYHIFRGYNRGCTLDPSCGEYDHHSHKFDVDTNQVIRRWDEKDYRPVRERQNPQLINSPWWKIPIMVIEDDRHDHAPTLQLPQTPKFVVTVLGNEEGVFLSMRINPRKPMYLLNQAPCGKTENGESSIQAAHRETYEETALSLAHRRFKYVGNDPNYDYNIY